MIIFRIEMKHATNCVQISIISTLTVRICGQVCKRDEKERRRDNVDKNEANSFSSYIQPKSLAKYLLIQK